MTPCLAPKKYLLKFQYFILKIALVLVATSLGALAATGSLCALIVHSSDADTPAHTAPIVNGLASIGYSTTVLCGTRECHRFMAGLGDPVANLKMLRVSRLVADTPLHDLFSSQEHMSILRVWLMGRRFEHAVGAAAALAGLAHLSSCRRTLYINHFWDGFLGPDEQLSIPRLRQLFNHSSPAALIDQQRLAALWLPRGDEHRPVHHFYMRRVDAMLRTVPERELLMPPPEDGWLEDVFCSLAEYYYPARCVRSAAVGLQGGTWHDGDDASRSRRSFHAVGYAANSGCRQSGGLQMFYEGDVFQSLAPLQYMPRLDGFVDVRLDGAVDLKGQTCEHIQAELRWPARPGGADDGRAYLMMAARWYCLGRFVHNETGLPPGWPPPDYITPIFVGFRIEEVPNAWAAPMLDWFNKWGPVGVRDAHNVEMLGRLGVKAIQTGCVTFGLRTWLCPGSRARRGGRSGMADGEGRHDDSQLASIAATSPALIFATPLGMCGKAFAPPHELEIAGVRMHCSLQHKWLSKDHRPGDNFVVYDLGVRYDMHTRAGRFQLCVNKFRAMRSASMIVTNEYFHVTMPSIGLAVPLLFVNSSRRHDNRFDGLTQMFTSVEFDASAPESVNAPILAEAVAAVRALRLPDDERCKADGRLAREDPHPSAARAYRDELYRRQLWLLARHPPILDAMNRLGAVDALMDDVEAADEAWIRGELPRALWPQTTDA